MSFMPNMKECRIKGTQFTKQERESETNVKKSKIGPSMHVSSNLCKQKIFFLLVNVTKYSLYGILEQIRVNIFLVFYRYSIFSFQIICLKTSIFFEEHTLFLMGGKFLGDSNLGVQEQGFRLGHFDIGALLPSQRQLENYTFKSHPLKGYQSTEFLSRHIQQQCENQRNNKC